MVRLTENLGIYTRHDDEEGSCQVRHDAARYQLVVTPAYSGYSIFGIRLLPRWSCIVKEYRQQKRYYTDVKLIFYAAEVLIREFPDITETRPHDRCRRRQILTR